MIDLSNQVALVTGGSRGIGAATALMLARAGANVMITYATNRKSADKVVRDISALGQKSQHLRLLYRITQRAKELSQVLLLNMEE